MDHNELQKKCRTNQNLATGFFLATLACPFIYLILYGIIHVTQPKYDFLEKPVRYSLLLLSIGFSITWFAFEANRQDNLVKMNATAC